MGSKAKAGRPIDADGHATRAKIMAAARSAFAERGYAATTYRILADSTGLAHSALYNYFDSKAELYAAVHNEVKDETYADWIEPALATEDAFVSRLDALFDVFVAMNAHSPDVARFLAAARIDTAWHPELAPIRDALPTQRRSLFSDMVELGVSTGELDPTHRGELLAMLDTMTIGLIEVCSEPELHKAAIQGFRRAVNAFINTSAS